MIKQEQKLIELGYELMTKRLYKKEYLNYGTIEIHIYSNKDYCIKIDIDNFESDINAIIKCMTEMQKDLKILKECEE